MLESLNNALRRAFDAYDDLTNREQWFVLGAAGFFTLLGLFIFGNYVDGVLDQIHEDIDDNQQVLETLERVAPTYRQKNAQDGRSRYAQKFTPDKLENNDVKLTSFVATQATATGVNVDSYDETDLPLESGSEGEESTLTKRQVNVEINEVSMDKLVDLLERIEMSEKPVFIERTKLVRRRNQKGSVRATLVVTTFKRQAEG